MLTPEPRACDATSLVGTSRVTLCSGMGGARRLVLLLLLSAAMESHGTSPPGKPILLGCRSPEKETFTCWWEPGADGGLPTTHHLFYEREGVEGVYECPDYCSAGSNSCFFDKKHTSIWVDYYLTVVAANAFGNATSDTLKMDVMQIVQPNAPENVTLLVEETEDGPNLHVRWERPYNTEAKSGWITLKYELRVKQGMNNEWKGYLSGTQTHFNLYGISPGTAYAVQVRCSLDHGSWSEWSNTTYAEVPNYLQNEKPFWILVSSLSAIPFMATMYILVTKRNYVKQCILPPVPGPKIRGVDFQHLKGGPHEDISALIINQNFPLMVGWKDQMEEYLTVTENDNKILSDASHSQRRKESLIIPAGFCLESEIQFQKECEKTKAQMDLKSNKFLSGDSLSSTETSQLPIEKQESPSENTLQPFTNNAYVDIRTHAENVQEADGVEEVDRSLNLERNSSGYVGVQRQEENMSDDYSRVKGVNSDNMVFLQNASVYTSCKEKGNHYTDCGSQKPTNPPVSGPIKVGMCTELIDSGYIDTVPEPPLM